MAMVDCPECEEEVSSDAEECPNCGHTLSKSVGCLLGLGILFLPILFSWFTLGKGYSNTTRLLAFGWLALSLVVPIGTMQSGGGSSSSSTKQVTEHDIGESFQLGGFQYQINDVSKRTRLGNRVSSETPSDGAVFLVVSYTIENVGDETSNVLANDFKIRDSSGRTFQPSSSANTALSMEYEDKDILLSQLQPGIEKEGMTAFEVPKQSTKKSMEFIVPTKDMFSNEKAVIEFQLNSDN